MRYECLIRRSKSDEIAFTAQASQDSLTIPSDTVSLQVERSVVDLAHLGRILAQEPSQENWQPADWCSLSGHVVQVSDEVKHIQVGDRLSAIGPLASQVILPIQECCVVPSHIDADQAAWWALLVALIRSVKKLKIEIGESVLILGKGTVGSLMAQLAHTAGATHIIGLDPEQGINSTDTKEQDTVGAPKWIARQDTLPAMLPEARADVLIDVCGDLTWLNRLLPSVKERGRVMSFALDGAATSDYDFYPHIHRRSLKWTSEVLKATPCQNSDDHSPHSKEAAFVDHLLNHGSLGPICQNVTYVYPIRLGEQILSLSETNSLIVQWTNHD
jgi:NADPH:quinone reductase-like Zn-dependent oxidoreductase